MRMLTISLLALALAGPVLVAQETPDNAAANARALLGSMKQVRAELLGRHKMHMSMVGIPFGEARLAITRSAYGIDECYRVEFVLLSRIDDLEMTNHSVAYVDAGMQLIWGSSNEVDGTRAKEEETIFRDGEKYTSFSPKDDGDELKKESFDARDTLIHDYTQPLLLHVLAGAKAGEYEFVSWSDLLGEYLPRRFTVKHDAKLGELECTHIVEVGDHGSEVNDVVVRQTRRAEYWAKDGRILRMVDEHAGMEVSENEIPRTRKQISREAVEKLDTPVHAAMGMMLAMERRDEEFLKRVFDVREMTIRVLKEQGMWEQIDPETLDGILDMAEEQFLETVLKGEEGSDPEATHRTARLAVALLLHEGLLAEYKSKTGDTIIGPAKDLPPELKLNSPWWAVEKQEDGTWRIVYLYIGETPELADESKEGEKEGDKKPEPDKPKEEDF